VTDPRRPSRHGFRLAIGGVEIQVRSQSPLQDQYDWCYLPFLTSGGRGEAASSLRVSVLSVQSPPRESQIVFESGGAWDMRLEGSGYRLSFRREGRVECHTVAFSNVDTSEVTVYVDQESDSRSSGAISQTNPVCYPLDQLLLMNHLAWRGGVVIHAGGVVVDGQTLVFAGASGAGKSTLSRLFVGGGYRTDLLSDDRIILRVPLGSSERPPTNRLGIGKPSATALCEAWGTPWPGDAMIAANARAPLGALLFLRQSDRNELVSLAPGVAMKRLMPLVSCPWYDRDRLPGVLDTCASLVESCSCYDFHFRPEPGAVALLAGSFRDD
jgi:hypothetical protein